MKVAILGGGITGLTAAYELIKEGYEISVIEKEEELGGMLRSIKIGETPIEIFYHHIFREDKEFLNLLKELGLRKYIEKKNTKTGFFYDDNLYELSAPQDLFFYDPLPFCDRIRLGLLILKIKGIKNPERYSEVSLREWVINNSNKKIYERFFKPLLKCRFGGKHRDISTAWFIYRMKMRSDRGIRGERLLYLRNGFKQVVDKLESIISKNSGEIDTGVAPKKIEINKGEVNKLYYGGREEEIDYLISTIPPEHLKNLINRNIGIPKPKWQRAICVLLGMKKSLSEYYWTNIIDNDIPFGAYIEHTNLQPKKLYGNQCLAYLASYPDNSSTIWKREDEEIFNQYFLGLKKMFNIKKEEINFWKVFKSEKASIVYERGIDSSIKSCKTNIPNLFVGGIFNSYPQRNIEESVKLGKRCAEWVKSNK